MESFTNNPSNWKIDGNIIGQALGELIDLSIFTSTHSTVTAGTTREIDERSIRFAKITYQP
jgi:hypothetical protein